MNKYFKSGDYFADASWSTTDGGASDTTLPTNVDDCFFTALSGACSVGASGCVAKSLNFTGYTNTITFANNILISGNLTLSPTMTMVGIGTIFSFNADATITTNGKYIPNSIATSVNPVVITLADTLVCQRIAVARPTTWLGVGFDALNYTINSSAALTNIFKVGNIYKIRDMFSVVATGTSHVLVRSDTPGTKVTLYATGECQLGFTDFTDIDANLGRPLYTFAGVVTNCDNINTLTDYLLLTSTTVSGMIMQ